MKPGAFTLNLLLSEGLVRVEELAQFRISKIFKKTRWAISTICGVETISVKKFGGKRFCIQITSFEKALQ